MNDRDKLLRDLAETRLALLRAVGGLETEDLQRLGACGPAWSALDVLAHIAAWERQTVEALRAHLTGASPYCMAGFGSLADTDRWNDAAVKVRRAWPLHERLLELSAVRNELLSLLAEVSDAQIDNRMGYPWGKGGPIRGLIDVSIEHDREHAAALAAWRVGL